MSAEGVGMDRQAASDGSTNSVSNVVLIEAWTCRFTLPKPIELSSTQLIAARDYIVVRLTANDGTEGVAYALTRGAPIMQALEDLVAPLVLGESPMHIPRIRDAFERRMAFLGSDGIALRAWSLADICLWDIKARHLGQPLWKVLGGFRQELPVLLVDLYPGVDADIDELVDRLLARSREGYRAFKVHFPGDVNWMAAFLAAVRESSLGWDAGIVIDASMAFTRTAEALVAMRRWEAFQPLWIEDPFRGEESELLDALRSDMGAPLGAGDEVASVGAMRRLIRARAVDVVRLDATCQGGVSGFLELACLARHEALAVSPHTYPEVHRHLGFARPGMDYVETFAPASDFDCAGRFVMSSSAAQPANGRLHAPESLGLGLEIDWEAVTAAAFASCSRLSDDR